MGEIVQFPAEVSSKFGFQRVQSTYTVREISQQFGLSEYHIRRWTREGLIQTAPSANEGELRYDFRALNLIRHVRELRHHGLSIRQVEAELHGQLNLFPEREGRLIRLPLRLSPFEEALLLHEHHDARAEEGYKKAIREGDCVADAYCNLGIMAFESGRMSAAFDLFTCSLKHDPRHFETHFNLANLYFENGELRLARLHYEIVAEIEPHFPNLYFNLGLVHAVNGDIQAAITALNKAKEMAPDEDHSKVDAFLATLLRVLNH
ncbi:MAG TPA: tetratricopeptide repeat protein [Acidobacteriota bacterium]|nr:tetratricopeptide repeat protein [Acidobacteriota bacterium]